MDKKTARFCTNCGKPIDEGTNFCPFCGSPNKNTSLSGLDCQPPKPFYRKPVGLTAIVVAVIALLLIGNTVIHHEHKWEAATCTEPQTCSKCKETEGVALGHQWKKATCTEPKLCKRCGLAEGEPAGHKWLSATYEAPETCQACGETQGEPLEIQYIDGHWESVKIKTSSSVYTISGWVFDYSRTLNKINITMEVSMNRGAHCDDWQLWGRVNGKFVKLGKIYLPGGDGTTTATVQWSDAKKIDAIAIAPTTVGGYSWSMGFLAWED